MSRYVRLGYIVPRLIALVAAAWLLQFAAGRALRFAVVDGGERLVGARVELGASSVDLLRGRASLAGLSVADPRHPMTDLLRADSVRLELDTDAALRRTIVVDRGVLRGLRFGAARATSGALDPDAESPALSLGGWTDGVDAEALAETVAPWMRDVGGRLRDGAAADLESPGLAEELAASWPRRYEELRREAAALRSDAERLRADLSEARSNPLRHADLIADLGPRTASLHDRLATLRQEVAAAPGRIAADRRRIDQAWRRDQALLRERLQADQLDADSLTSALLGSRVTSAVAALTDGVRWARSLTPAPDEDPTTPARRGADVRFEGVAQRPDVLVRSLELFGVAELGGSPAELTGRLTDFTTTPSAHPTPARLELRIDGPTGLHAVATIDRTGPTPVDDLTVQIDALRIAAQTLPIGSDASLTVAPSTAAAELTLRVKGERIAGQLRLVQDRLRVSTAHAAVAAGESRAVDIDGVVTRVKLAGTLDRPRIGLKSDAGAALASALRESVESLAAEQVQRLTAGARQRIDAALADLDGVLASATQGLAVDLTGPARLVEGLGRAGASPIGGGLPFRFPQLSGRASTQSTQNR